MRWLLVKMLFLTWAVFAPLYIWFIRLVVLDKLPHSGWPGLVGLAYTVLGVSFLVFMHKRLYAKELAAAQASNLPISTHVPEIVWISSVEHLRHFRDLPPYAKWFGFVPKGFPKVRAGLLYYPLLYFAQANLNLNGNSFQLSAFAPASEGIKAYANLIFDLRLSFEPGDVLSVSRFDMKQVMLTDLPLPFIRVQTRRGQLRDFLVCAGSNNPSLIIRETENLWFALGDFVSKGRNAHSVGSELPTG
jgi:hypothetical protein